MVDIDRSSLKLVMFKVHSAIAQMRFPERFNPGHANEEKKHPHTSFLCKRPPWQVKLTSTVNYSFCASQKKQSAK